MREGQKPIKLLARDVQDLKVISALVQDALVPVGDITYLRDEGSFVLALNRFRWEAGASEPSRDAEGHFERVHAGLRFDKVTRAQYSGLSLSERGRLLSLLAVAYDSGVVVLQFADDASIRLEVEDLLCALRDLGEPWPTHWKPGH